MITFTGLLMEEDNSALLTAIRKPSLAAIDIGCRDSIRKPCRTVGFAEACEADLLNHLFETATFKFDALLINPTAREIPASIP
jgi:hypothetical protein